MRKLTAFGVLAAARWALVAAVASGPVFAHAQASTVDAAASESPTESSATPVPTTEPPATSLSEPAQESPDLEAPSYRLIAAEISALEQARAEIGLGGPIVLSAAGGVVIGVGASVFLIGLAMETVCPRNVGDSGGALYSADCIKDDDTPAEVMIVGGVIGAAGGVVFAFGLSSLLGRIGDRRALGRRIKELRLLQQSAGDYGSLQLDLGPDRAGISGYWRF
jgi:hypothetical protein